MSVKWLGWGTYTDTGELYRRWEFTEDVPEVKAEKGFLLDDEGPTGTGPRFGVRKPGGTKRVYGPSEEEVAEHVFYSLGLPRWRPPTTDGLRLVDGLKSLEEAIQAVARATREGNAAHQKLNEVRKVLGSGEKEPNRSTKQNRFLRLKGDFEYDNGDPYRDWELLVDVPSIPATRSGKVHPRHAVKGDVLRERDDDELTPFELRREGKRIGDPEWWQLRHLFEGLDASERETALPEGWGRPPDTPDGRILATVLPPGVRKTIVTGQSVSGTRPNGQPWESDDRAFNDSPFWGSAWITARAVPAVDLPAGAIVLFSDHGLDKAVRDVFAKGRQLPRPDFPKLLDNLDALRLIDASGCLNPEAAKHSAYLYLPPGEKAARAELRKYLSRKASWTGKTKSVRVAMIVPLVSPVSAPIQAGSDEEAVFELLYQVTRGA